MTFYEVGKILVGFREGTTESRIEEITKETNLQILKKTKIREDYLVILKVKPGTEEKEKKLLHQKYPEIDLVELIYSRRTCC